MTDLTQEIMDLGVNNNNGSIKKRGRKRNHERTVNEDFMRGFVNSIMDDVSKVFSNSVETEPFIRKWKDLLQDEISAINPG